MMKNVGRFGVLTGTVALAGVLLSPSAFATTSVTPYGGPGNGGDYGYGNCGRNNSGDAKLSGAALGAATGAGGYRHTACPVAPAAPTTPTETVTPVAPAPTVVVAEGLDVTVVEGSYF